MLTLCVKAMKAWSELIVSESHLAYPEFIKQKSIKNKQNLYIQTYTHTNTYQVGIKYKYKFNNLIKFGLNKTLLIK